MTTPPQPTPPGEKPIGQYLRPLRDLAVYALAGLPAVLLFTGVIDLFGTDFFGRTRYSFGSFVNLVTIFFPLAAVLLALGVKPVHPKARLIVLTALIEYGVVAFFGLVFGVLFGVSGIATDDPGGAFTELLTRLAWLAVFGLAVYAVVQIWRGVYPPARPQPGVYGQPQYGPPQYGQPPYGQPYGQPPYGQAPPGQPPFAQPPQQQQQQFGAPQPGYGPQPGHPAPGYGQPHPGAQPPPGGQPTWNQPPVATPPVGNPPPSSGAPASGVPVPPFSEPTQVVPKAEDLTEKLPDNRPGFGPADEDPPRQ
ncbi:DUF1206 domain-containing protein [Actinoplanes aureus]|uniref:Uncharacterized protein n=1 Tax=Actinoplanes aureus TaxID=2792083 RepID=A0A931C492_9ACTN|nr:DUF1206 domain-containing protein [Actinoplanes aureus]MBG0563135.1 hypothetical protein [Actinoplanes aureus]